MNNTENSFIKNVNNIAANLELIKQVPQLFDEETILRLEKLSDINITQITEDLKKGNYAGSRKLDIDLRLNNASTESECSYSAAKIYLKDGTIVEIPFLNTNNAVYEIASHTALYNKLVSSINEYNVNNANTENTLILDFEIDLVNENLPDADIYIRIRDVDGKTTNIKRITLTYYNGGLPITLIPEYTFVKTTSSLQILSNQISEVLTLLVNVDQIVALSQKDVELTYLYENRNVSETLYTNYLQLKNIHENLTSIIESKTNAYSALVSKNQTQQYLADVNNLVTQINNITAGETYTLTAGSPAKVSKNPTTNKFDFWVPQGSKGDKGESYNVNAVGTLAERAAYDSVQPLFSFLASDTNEYIDPDTNETKYIPHLFIKKTNAVGDWIDAGAFGRGDTGPRGYGILSINFDSSTDPSNEKGKAGATDTYKITIENGAEFFFEVSNAVIGNLNDINNPQTFADIVVLENSNKLLVNPIKFNSITIHSNGNLKLI